MFEIATVSAPLEIGVNRPKRTNVFPQGAFATAEETPACKLRSVPRADAIWLLVLARVSGATVNTLRSDKPQYGS